MKNTGLNDQKGMILIIVIVAIMLMSIVVMGVLSRNVSKSLSDEKSIQNLQAELLAKGGFWRAYQNGGVPPADFSETIAGKTYNVTYSTVNNAGPLGTSEVVTRVDF